MYSLVALLALLATACFLRAYARRRRGPSARGRGSSASRVSLAAMLYTHNWAIFFALACGVAWLALLSGAPSRPSAARCCATACSGFGGALAALPAVGADDCSTRPPTPARRGRDAPDRSVALGATPGQMLGHIAQVVLLIAAGARRGRAAGSAAGGALTPRGPRVPPC